MTRKTKESNLLEKTEIKKEEVYKKKIPKKRTDFSDDSHIIYKAENKTTKVQPIKTTTGSNKALGKNKNLEYNKAEKKSKEQLQKNKEQIKAQKKIKTQDKIEASKKQKVQDKIEAKKNNKIKKEPKQTINSTKNNKSKVSSEIKKEQVTSIELNQNYVKVLKKLSTLIYLSAILVIGIPICIVLYRELPLGEELSRGLINIGFILTISAKTIVIIRKLLEKKTIYLDLGALIGFIIAFILYRIS